VLYARFIGDTRNYVLNALIDATLAKDRDLIAWRTEQQAASVVQPHRVPQRGACPYRRAESA
jgi:hypothetical protein